MSSTFSSGPDTGPLRTAIGIDVGGTKIAGAVVTGRGDLVEARHVATPAHADAEQTVAVLAAMAGDLTARYPDVETIGVGAPGMVTWPTGHIASAPNNAYRDLALKDRLAEATGLPVVVDNDANAAAWAEKRFGRGVGHRDVVVLTVGTGIGGGVIVNGDLFRGATGLGGEVGHTIINPGGGNRCGCGAFGCLETEASGTALRRLGREAAARNPDGAIARLAVGGEVTGEIVTRAAKDGDPTARTLFEELGTWLGLGIASIVNNFEPEIVILGGGLVDVGELLLAPAQAAYQRHVVGRDVRRLPPLVPAALGPEAGVIGAAALALDELKPVAPVP
ncbi:ROK family glucokinase [Actinomadura meridiana]|uniref:Glucokinase n=1 Tax=Actinomadura meridiana TaxID=559626 RepID=A0ABP8CM27_9ACTN